MNKPVDLVECPTRHALPARRLSENRHVILRGNHKVFLTIGYDPSEPMRPREIFYSAGFRSGCDLEYQMQDVCIMLSLLLQCGQTPEEVAKSFARVEDHNGNSHYASLIGDLVAEVAKAPEWAKLCEENQE